MDALQEHKVPSLHLTPGRDSLNTGDREENKKNDKSTTLFSTRGKNSLEKLHRITGTASEFWLKVTCTPENPMKNAVNISKNDGISLHRNIKEHPLIK